MEHRTVVTDIVIKKLYLKERMLVYERTLVLCVFRIRNTFKLVYDLTGVYDISVFSVICVDGMEESNRLYFVWLLIGQIEMTIKWRRML